MYSVDVHVCQHLTPHMTYVNDTEEGYLYSIHIWPVS